MARAELTVKVSEIPTVKALIERLENERDDLRHLLQQWEERVTCPQCGLRYSKRACGPSHAVVASMVKGDSGSSVEQP